MTFTHYIHDYQPAQRRNNGFTLLELLIAISLSTLVMLVLSIGINVVVKDWTRAESRLEQQLDDSLILLQLERALEGAFPHTYRDADKNQQIVLFEGKKDELLWVSTVSPGQRNALAAWSIKPGEDERGLALRITTVLTSNPDEQLEEMEPRYLLPHYKVSFAYLYLDQQLNVNDKKPEWLDKWSGEDQRGLPDAVRIVFTPADDSAEEPLEVIAPIRAYENNTIRRLQPV